MADLRLTELLRVLDLAALRERRNLDDMRRAVVRQYRRIALDEAARELRAALDAPNPKSARARTDLVLRALDIAVKELKLPPTRAEQIIRQAVRDRVQTLDELLRLQNPELSFNDPREVQARAVSVARREMNTYWAKEQKRFRDDVAKTVRQAVRQGLPPEKAADLLEQRLGVSRSRAVLIATDQMLTAAANADRQRQRDMGVKEYLWRTVGDKRVRREHQVRNGKRYRWADGGEYPGQAIRCRCRALPLVRDAVPDTERSVPGMTDPQNEVHLEQLREGRHVADLDIEEISATKARFILRGATHARLTDLLAEQPLAALHLHPFSPGTTTGRYHAETRTLELNTGRAGITMGSTRPIGEVAAISAWGKTKEAAMQMSFVHELGHHVLEVHAPAFELALAAARHPDANPVSLRARANWQEYFCETLTAYTFFEEMLMLHDPVGHKMIQDLHVTLRR